MRHAYIPKTHFIPHQMRVSWLLDIDTPVWRGRPIARIYGELRLTYDGETTHSFLIMAPADGILRKLLVSNDSIVPEGTIIALIGTLHEVIPLRFQSSSLQFEDLPGNPALRPKASAETIRIIPGWFWWVQCIALSVWLTAQLVLLAYRPTLEHLLLLLLVTLLFSLTIGVRQRLKKRR